MHPNSRGQTLDGGLLLGAMAVLAFSFTLPATRAAVPSLGVLFVGLGRSVVAGVLAAIYLATSVRAWPPRRDFVALAIIALGVVFGFPLLAALAMRSLPASHGAVVTGLIPCATAIMAVWRAGERPPRLFWFGCTMGVIAVLVFASAEGAGKPQAADLVLLLGVAGAALGYAEGTRLARAWGPGSGIRVISWVLVLGAPLAAFIVAASLISGPRPRFEAVTPHAWFAFAYLSVISAYVGFFPWYAGLARGGVARVGQVQLIQPILTLVWSVLLLGEPLRWGTVAAALLVIVAAGMTILARKPGHLDRASTADPHRREHGIVSNQRS
jgi:drug/metabolite transporter (DMT)-like permease